MLLYNIGGNIVSYSPQATILVWDILHFHRIKLDIVIIFQNGINKSSSFHPIAIMHLHACMHGIPLICHNLHVQICFFASRYAFSHQLCNLSPYFLVHLLSFHLHLVLPCRHMHPLPCSISPLRWVLACAFIPTPLYTSCPTIAWSFEKNLQISSLYFKHCNYASTSASCDSSCLLHV